MKHEGFATAFERLDREIAALRRLVALSSLFSWNYATKIVAVRLEVTPEKPRRFWAHAPIEWLVACLAVCVALCSCGGKDVVKRELTQAETEALFATGERHAFTVDLACEMQDGRIGLILSPEENQ